MYNNWKWEGEYHKTDIRKELMSDFLKKKNDGLLQLSHEKPTRWHKIF